MIKNWLSRNSILSISLLLAICLQPNLADSTSASEAGIELPNAFILSRWMLFCYCLLCFTSVYQLTLSCCHRHSAQSFRFGFLSIAVVWTILRILFFTHSNENTPTIYSTLLYYLPTSCQLATFSLLLLFYTQIVDLRAWKRSHVTMTAAFAFYQILHISITIAFSIWLAQREILQHTEPNITEFDEDVDWWTNIYSFISSVFFGILCGFAAKYLYKLHESSAMMQKQSSSSFTIDTAPQTPLGIVNGESLPPSHLLDRPPCQGAQLD